MSRWFLSLSAVALFSLELTLHVFSPSQQLRRSLRPSYLSQDELQPAGAGVPALSRSLPEHGTLTSPCDRNSAYIDARIKWLWEQSQAGEDWAMSCCNCLDCRGGDAKDSPTCISQFGQDLFLYRNFFRCLPERGSYVDVGAHHPMTLSSTYFMDVCLGYDQGSLCVEPSQAYSELFAGARSCKLAQAAAGSKDGGFVYLSSQGALSHTSSSSEGEGSAQGERVRAATLATLLRENNLTIGDSRTGEMVIIDLLSIDVEGKELDVLLGVPWDSIWARIIMVENVRGSQDVFEFLMDKGYTKFATLAVDDFYYKIGLPLRRHKEMNYHRMATASMRKTELGVLTYEHDVLYKRQWEHIFHLHKATGDIPLE